MPNQIVVQLENKEKRMNLSFQIENSIKHFPHYFPSAISLQCEFSSLPQREFSAEQNSNQTHQASEERRSDSAKGRNGKEENHFLMPSSFSLPHISRLLFVLLTMCVCLLCCALYSVMCSFCAFHFPKN